MRRQTVYPGAVPLETDILNTNKNTMIAIGHVLQDMLGTSTLFSGLGCVPTGPAGMTVNVNPGRAYSLQSTDTGAYSSLAADATPLMKQGILLSLVNFACPAPTTAGFSINYLIEGAFQEVDAGSTVLPYYNAANPAVAFSGPNGTGTSNTTFRDNTVQLQLKPGAAATTGSQVTPTPDAGFNGLWVVTVPFGATTITSGNITQFSGAPFLTAALLTQIQAIPTSGRLLGVQTITASGTYTPGTYNGVTATKAIVEAVGGGGGGGGVPATAASQVAIGGSGSAGGYGKIFISSGLTSQTVTIGAAGAAGSAGVNAGGSGGATLFAGLLVCNGGGGGGSANAAAGPTFAFPVGGGSVSGTGVFLSKMVGQIAQVGISINNTLVTSGSGGNSPLGTGGSQAAGAAGAPATAGGFGGGGSGAGLVQGQSASAGGSGTPGVIIVYEYA